MTEVFQVVFHLLTSNKELSVPMKEASRRKILHTITAAKHEFSVVQIHSSISQTNQIRIKIVNFQKICKRELHVNALNVSDYFNIHTIAMASFNVSGK